MLTAIIVSKLTLEGQLLQSLMQSVVKGWGAESARSGLACLAFLAQALGLDGVHVSDEESAGHLPRLFLSSFNGRGASAIAALSRLRSI